ncbi:MAG: hypothetical protein IJ223_07250 [Clostridia bacterium]|nr:hypothetical protein [Clostridia bacterium]
MKGNHSLEKEFNFVSVLKIIIVLAIIGAIIFGIVMLVMNHISKAKIEEDISKVIDSSFTALKNLDKENVNKYLDYDKLISGLDEMLIKEEDTNIEKELFKDITWSIENIEINNDEATVIVELTNKSFKNILTKWMKDLIADVNNGNQILEEGAINNLEEIIKKEEDNKVELKKVKLKKYEDTWKIEVNDDFIDLVYPGIDSVTEILN